ncbi:MAG TPA: hypothetical protein VK807_17970 [Gemmatimonadaceae bacterium]|nr:hypothetical protein [Gemmatimonadaceae bacterium]
MPSKKKARVIDLREVEKKIAEYKEHVEHDRRFRTVVKELDQARLAIRKGFDRLLEAVSKQGRPKPATAKRAKKRTAKKVTGRKGPRRSKSK